MQYQTVFPAPTRSFFTLRRRIPQLACSRSRQALGRISGSTPDTPISTRIIDLSPLPRHYLSSMATLKRKPDPLTASTSDLKKPKKDASLTSFFGAPKASNASTKSASSTSPITSASEPALVKFDKDKWVSGLSDEQKKLVKLEIDTLDSSWLAHLREEVLHKDFLELKRFLQNELDSGKKIFPPLEEVYSW
jgi:hypothetical protein